MTTRDALVLHREKAMFVDDGYLHLRVCALGLEVILIYRYVV